MSIRDWLQLIAAIAVCQAAGGIGALFTTPSIEGWYDTLLKPAVVPPNWVFAPVWTALFILMGIAAFLVWRNGLSRKDVRVALGLFMLQLVLNTLWSIIFFGYHVLGAASVEIILLWLAILATIITFAKISRLAALLLLPYIAWVSFATYLTIAIWTLNT